jgi:hypothetical protein
MLAVLWFGENARETKVCDDDIAHLDAALADEDIFEF